MALRNFQKFLSSEEKMDAMLEASAIAGGNQRKQAKYELFMLE